jgi:uncharacterized membrane protein YfcA
MGPITPLSALAIFAAGTAAGAINAVVGSGSLITFPTLLAAGYDPLVANMSNTLGLVPGSISGALGYRQELGNQQGRLRWLGPASALGGVVGAVLLFALPGSVFERVVPILILLACTLMALQPRLVSRFGLARDRGRRLWVGVFATGIYGGYFGAAQGVILIALLSIFYIDGLQRLNALKNVLAGIVNGIAAILFVVFGDIDFAVAGVLAVSSTLGGQLGARYGRRLPSGALRALVITIGVFVALKLVVDP